MQFALIDEPSPFASLKAWHHLRDLRTLGDDVVLKAEMIEVAQRIGSRSTPPTARI
jgi:hypothetical protein